MLTDPSYSRELANCQPYHFEIAEPIKATLDPSAQISTTVHRFELFLGPERRKYFQVLHERCIEAGDDAAMWLFPPPADLLAAMEPIGPLPMRASFPTGALLFNVPVMLSPWTHLPVIITKACVDEVQR